MVCIYCQGSTKVTNSRHLNRTNGTWRRRKCLNCKSIFTSIEGPILNEYWTVLTKSKVLEPFNRDRLYISIFSSLGHRDSCLNDASELTANIITKLFKFNSLVIEKSSLRTITHETLLRFDQVAGTYYQAYYMNPDNF